MESRDIKQILNTCFYFWKGDRRAVVALGCVAVFCMGVLLVVDALRGSRGTSSEVDGKELTGWGTDNVSAPSRNANPIFVPHVFDPNTVDSLTLVGFGLKPWKVRNFLHYRTAGKVFRSAEDMGRTYGWTEDDVAMLEPYVRVGERYRRNERKWEKREQWERKEEKPEHTSNKYQTLTKVNINTADTALLRRIPGIGEKISLAIVRYRQRLGGFHSVNQLLDIKIVSPELLDWMEVSSTPDIQRINVNKASFQALNSHPYISYEQTKALLQYIRLYGPVRDEEALFATGIFTREDVERLRPYVVYE